MLNQPLIDYAGPTWDSNQTGARKEEKSLFHPMLKSFIIPHIIVFFVFWFKGHGKLQI